MKKIAQLYRLDFKNKVLFLQYYLKRILGLRTSTEERNLNEYYFHLIQNNGKLLEENSSSFVSFYKDLGLTIKIRKRPSSDLNVFAQIFIYKEYDALVEFYKKHFPNDQKINFIDAGCNIGLTVLYLSKKFKDMRVITFEPDQSNTNSIIFNTSANQIKNVKLIKGGLWYKNTFLKIVNDFRDKMEWSIRVEETNENTGLYAYSLNEIVKENEIHVIDILKIDVEGSEKEVFTNLNTNISFLEKTKCIAIEIHDEFECREDIVNILEKHNFTWFNSGELTIGVNQKFIN